MLVKSGAEFAINRKVSSERFIAGDGGFSLNGRFGQGYRSVHEECVMPGRCLALGLPGIAKQEKTSSIKTREVNGRQVKN